MSSSKKPPPKPVPSSSLARMKAAKPRDTAPEKFLRTKLDFIGNRQFGLKVPVKSG
jgi:hypothetical protein